MFKIYNIIRERISKLERRVGGKRRRLGKTFSRIFYFASGFFRRSDDIVLLIQIETENVHERKEISSNSHSCCETLLAEVFLFTNAQDGDNHLHICIIKNECIGGQPSSVSTQKKKNMYTWKIPSIPPA